MESLYTLIGICFGVFILFFISEVIALKKDVKKINGIIKYLLEKDKENYK